MSEQLDATLAMETARAYGIPLIDYERNGRGLLLAVGSGLMMATMDEVSQLRWCVDLGGGKTYDRLADWLTWMNRIADVVVVSAWFTVTSPDRLKAALSVLRAPVLLVKSNVDLGVGKRLDDLRAIGEYVNDLEANASVAGGVSNE